MPTSRVELAERFWSFVEVRSRDQCWLWQRKPNADGYGTLWHQGEPFLAHRLAYMLETGDWGISAIDYICHTCDDRLCCNPNHLYKGDAKTNAEDRKNRGRNATLKGESHGRAVLSEEDVVTIWRLYQDGEQQKDIATRFGVSAGTISAIINGCNWKNVTDRGVARKRRSVPENTVHEIRRLLKRGVPSREISEVTGESVAYIGKIRRGERR